MKKTKIDNEWQSEWYGGKVVPIMSYEPDPNSFREKYYVNSVTGCLYKKSNATNGLKTWQEMSR